MTNPTFSYKVTMRGDSEKYIVKAHEVGVQGEYIRFINLDEDGTPTVVALVLSGECRMVQAVEETSGCAEEVSVEIYTEHTAVDTYQRPDGQWQVVVTDGREPFKRWAQLGLSYLCSVVFVGNIDGLERDLSENDISVEWLAEGLERKGFNYFMVTVEKLGALIIELIQEAKDAKE